MTPTPDKPLTIRERIVIRLVMFIIQLLNPYEYEYQFKEYFKEMKELINLKTEEQK